MSRKRGQDDKNEKPWLRSGGRSVGVEFRVLVQVGWRAAPGRGRARGWRLGPDPATPACLLELSVTQQAAL